MATNAIRGANQIWTGIETGDVHSGARGLIDMGAATAVGLAMFGPDAWATGAVITAVGMMGGRAAYDVWSPDEKLSLEERTSKFVKNAGQFAGGLGASSIAWGQIPIAMPNGVARPLAVVGGSLGIIQAYGELKGRSSDRVASFGRLTSGALSVVAGLTGSPAVGVATIVAGAGVTAWTTLADARQLGSRAKGAVTGLWR